MSLATEEITRTKVEQSLRIKGYDHLEFYVGNAHQAAHFYRTAFGFRPTAYMGLETGSRERVSIVLEQRNIKLVLTSPLDNDGPVAQHVRLHGDGVKDIAFTVDDATQAFEETVRRGARPIQEPTTMEDDAGYITRATVSVYGDTVHSFIERKEYTGAFLPEFQPIRNPPLSSLTTCLAAIDHVAISLERDTLDEWVEFYENVMGFRQSHQEDVVTECSAMRSKVVQHSSGLVKFPLVEPAIGQRKSQIEEYLKFYRGPGVQHVALLSSNIVQSVKALRAGGNEFLNTPGIYYEMLEDRVGKIDEDVEALREQKVLVDRDEWGYLMQIFTKPVQNRPTFFLEAIQRKGARGFGSGNIKALFQALEREQAGRGNL
jgi:4-hydroxyphenylpyruvate dioxygenase